MILDKNKTAVLILTHYAIRTDSGEDTDQRVRNFLLPNVKKIVHITHPLHDFENQVSYFQVYENGKLTKEKKVSLPKTPFWISYLIHPILNYIFIIIERVKYDLCISMEDLSFITIYPLRLLGLIKRLVYYTIDFSPQRFSNNLIDNLYHKLDKFACTQSDAYWAMTKEMKEGRKKFGINSKNIKQFTIVPIGYDTQKIKLLPLSKISYHEVVYMGALRESTGVELTIKAMPYVIKEIPDIKLTVSGHGILKDHLISLTHKLKITKNVEFTGYVASFWDLTKMMARKSIGLAPYPPLKGSYTNYSDPSKIKLMMACGLPVITTAVTTMTELINKTKSGVIINYSEKELAKAICLLLTDMKRYKQARIAVINLIPQFDIYTIMANAISEIPA